MKLPKKLREPLLIDNYSQGAGGRRKRRKVQRIKSDQLTAMENAVGELIEKDLQASVEKYAGQDTEELTVELDRLVGDLTAEEQKIMRKIFLNP